MNRELIINVSPKEITIALAEDKRLVQLSKEDVRSGFSVGDIYLGKVKKIMPGLNAAFVNIGHEKDAFIHYLDLGSQFATLERLAGQLIAKKRPPKFENIKLEQNLLPKTGKIGEWLNVGDNIVVQIAKESISTKGPRLTSDLSLAGRNVVLIPFTNKVSISQKIRSNAERKRLKKIADSILPHNYGVIIRTAAMGKDEQDLRLDITSLIERWQQLLTALKTAQAPVRLLGENNRATTIIRDSLNDTFSSIVVDDKDMYEDIKGYIRTIAPDKEKIVKLYKGNVPLFDDYDITRQMKTLFAKYVSLKRGAYLIIERTEALNVIDVNSGNRTQPGVVGQEAAAMEVNLAAAAEIARQLRLRDMGGIIIIDFIDLHKAENRQTLQKHMQELMTIDKAKHTILPLTKFGLMQITRHRVRPEAVKEITEVCPACNGTGKISSPIPIDKVIENQIAYLADDKGIKELTLRVNPIIEGYLIKGLRSVKKQWAKKYHTKLRIEGSYELGMVEFRILDRKGREIGDLSI